MNPVIILCYNLFLISAFAAAASLTAGMCIAKGPGPWKPMAGMFFFFFADTIIIFLTETLPGFGEWYNHMFVLIPAIKTAIYLGIAFFSISLWNVFLNRAFSPIQGAALAVLGLWYLFIPLSGNKALMVWLYYSAYQVFSFILSIWTLRRIQPAEHRCKADGRDTRFLLFSALAFSLIILLEDTFTIFYVDVYEKASVYIQNRNFSEDFLRIIYVIYAVRFFVREMTAVRLNRDIRQPSAQLELLRRHPDPKNLSEEQTFAHYLYLTGRESEVLILMLENKSNQEICEELCISIGTVKAHIHNIFLKADVTRRSELLRNYYFFIHKASA